MIILKQEIWHFPVNGSNLYHLLGEQPSLMKNCFAADKLLRKTKKMKPLTTCLLALLLLAGCKKEDTKPNPYWGEVTANHNGEPWRADVYAVEGEENFTLLIHVLDEIGGREESLGFSYLPSKTGRHKIFKREYDDNDTLTPQVSYFTLVESGHVLSNVYHLDEEADNYLTIDEIDFQTNGEVKGSFQLTFMVEKPKKESRPNDPDTVVFTQGRFHTRFVDPELLKVENYL